jgi:hypothetical protein
MICALLWLELAGARAPVRWAGSLDFASYSFRDALIEKLKERCIPGAARCH